MALDTLTQAERLIQKSKSLVLIIPPNATADHIASLAALYLTLEPLKDSHLDEVSPSHVPTNLQFLAGTSQILTAPRKSTEILLDIANSANPLTFSTTTLQGGTRVHIQLPNDTNLTKDQCELSIRSFPYDLIITLGLASPEDLGDLYSNDTDFFYHTPIINLDYQAQNEHYGTVNLVDITASSLSEVTHQLISIFTPDLNPDQATALYAGLISGTESFQKPTTTPSAFQLASQLLDSQADKESVIQHLVKTKPLSLIKLAGRLYARLRYDQHGQIFWSLLRSVDFQDSQAKHSDLKAAMYELSNNIAGFTAAFVLVEQASDYHVYLMLGKGLLQKKSEIQKSLNATKDNGHLHWTIPATSLAEAEKSALDAVRQILPY